MNKRIAEMIGLRLCDKWTGLSLGRAGMHYELSKAAECEDCPGNCHPAQSPPNFKHSMDVCKKWLVPWLREHRVTDIDFALLEDSFICSLWVPVADGPIPIIGTGPSMSEALCNASLEVKE